MRVIVERGFSEVRLQDILDAAQVTKGKFFHHFSSKEDLFKEALRSALSSRKFIDFGAVVEKTSATSSYGKLCALLDEVIAWHRQGLPASMRLCLVATFFFPPDSPEIAHIKKRLLVNMKVLRDLVQAAQREGDLPDDLDASAFSLLVPSTTVGGNIVQYLSAKERLPSQNLSMLRNMLEHAHRATSRKRRA